MDYIYSDIENNPDLLTSEVKYRIEPSEEVSGELEVVFYDKEISGIHYDIKNSEMTDKSIEFCVWNEKDRILHVYFTNELSNDDKEILDSIIQNNT